MSPRVELIAKIIFTIIILGLAIFFTLLSIYRTPNYQECDYKFCKTPCPTNPDLCREYGCTVCYSKGSCIDNCRPYPLASFIISVIAAVVFWITTGFALKYCVKSIREYHAEVEQYQEYRSF
jgi:hypothetical protein